MKISIFLTLILCSLGAYSKDETGGYAILGRGTISCGAVAAANEKSNKVGNLAISEWVNGYLTAFNILTYGAYDLTKNVDLDGRKQWILKYCKDNPLEMLAVAAKRLADELEAKQ
ncbi:MAG: hypothetical protein ACI91R_001607 [Vicingaceae bacterium]|jgi:hypothetical protein